MEGWGVWWDGRRVVVRRGGVGGGAGGGVLTWPLWDEGRRLIAGTMDGCCVAGYIGIIVELGGEDGRGGSWTLSFAAR